MQTKTNPASPAASVASGQSETRTPDRQTASPARWPPGNSNSSFQENHGKRIQITSLPDRPRPLLSGGVLWEMCKWRIVAISCCVARYFNLRHVNDYRSYLIKGRTPLIETQNNVRNKSTIVFQKCNLNNRKSLLRRSCSRGICPQTPSYAHPALWMAPRSLKNLTLLLVLPKIIKPRKSV